MPPRPQSLKSVINLNAVRRAPAKVLGRISSKLGDPAFDVGVDVVESVSGFNLREGATLQRLLRLPGVRVALMMHEYLGQALEAQAAHDRVAQGVVQEIEQRVLAIRGNSVAIPRALRARLQATVERRYPRYRAFRAFERSLGRGRRQAVLRYLLRRWGETSQPWNPTLHETIPWPKAESECRCMFWNHAISDILRFLKSGGHKPGPRQKSSATHFVLTILCPEIWGAGAFEPHQRGFHRRCMKVDQKPLPRPGMSFLRR